MNADIVVLSIIILALAVLLHWLPTWRGRGLWFGVTVAPDFERTPEARAALNRYRFAVWTLAVIAIGLVAAGVAIGPPLLAEAGALVLAFGATVAFAMVRRRILPFAVKGPGSSAPLSTDHLGLPGGAASVMVPLGIVAATALYLRTHWDQLPERIPRHWTIDGTPNRWADRTWHSVYGPLLVAVLMSLFILLMAEAIIHVAPRGRVAGTEAWNTRFRRANLMLLVVSVWGLCIMMSVFALAPLFSGSPYWNVFAWATPLAMLLALVPFMWQIIRIALQRENGADGTPDARWKFGLFYYNPDDPALLVEKRFGVGYTFNFANRTLWWVAGIAVMTSLLVVAVTR